MHDWIKKEFKTVFLHSRHSTGLEGWFESLNPMRLAYS